MPSCYPGYGIFHTFYSNPFFRSLVEKNILTHLNTFTFIILKCQRPRKHNVESPRIKNRSIQNSRVVSKMLFTKEVPQTQ